MRRSTRTICWITGTTITTPPPFPPPLLPPSGGPPPVFPEHDSTLPVGPRPFHISLRPSPPFPRQLSPRPGDLHLGQVVLERADEGADHYLQLAAVYREFFSKLL